MRIYNTLTKQKEEFVPREDKKVKMFVCGPTVYDFSHIGHARTYIIYDAIARYLRYRGYKVFYLQNITDIDDKIIERANKSGKRPLELAKEFTNYYYEDMKALNINSVDKYAPATEYIPQIISQVERLLKTGYAYLIENDPSTPFGEGGYYFDLSKFTEYGKLSGRTTEAAEDAVSRIDEGVNKKNRGDFALWKFSKPDEPSWPSKELGEGLPRGEALRGRPGWHIEDTAITEANLGPQYDLHGGALELIFPHHEAEIAQMESLSGAVPLVRYWVHSGVLTIDGKKMAKSLGNFITIRDLLKSYSPEVIRFMALSAHYRSPLDYSEKILSQSEAAVQRIAELKQRISFYHGKEKATTEQADAVLEIYDSVIEALEDDFDTPVALARFFDTIKLINKYLEQDIDIAKLASFSNIIRIFDDVFGIVPKTALEVPTALKDLIAERERFRVEKDYAAADQIRSQIESLGYQIDDTVYGPLIKKK